MGVPDRVASDRQREERLCSVSGVMNSGMAAFACIMWCLGLARLYEV